MMKMRMVALVAGGAVLTGCAAIDRLSGRPADGAAPQATGFAPAVETTSLQTLAAGQSPAALDQTSAETKAAALSAPASDAERELGRVTVALGAPAEQGLWLQSALVQAPGQGRVMAANGQSLAVELRPGSGAALMSLAAYQALGIALTDLPEVTIYAR